MNETGTNTAISTSVVAVMGPRPTAHAMTVDPELCQAACMNDYLPKPMNMKELTRSLEKWLKNA